jgi:hypothetical protein
MSIENLDVIERLPYELAARLEADAFFADIPVVVADEGNVKATLEKKQAVITSKGGKVGAAVIVLQVIGDDEFTNVAFGPLRLRPAFQVVENRELNLGPNGTGKSARKIARRVVTVIKPLRLSGMTTDFECDKPCIEPVSLKDDVAKNLVAYQVNFACAEADTEGLEQASMPRFEVVGNQLVMTCATEGATIWFTTDDSYPAPQTDGADDYTSPIDLTEGMIVRACAYQDGKVASQVARVVVVGEEMETAN